MPFSQTHDAWIREGLVKAAFSLTVVSPKKGSWGQVEDLPVDVYACDFEQYDPPAGFPPREICCVRTQGAWWIILTKPLFEHLLQLARDGELPRGFDHAMALMNERQIGAWLLVRDRALSGDQALDLMDQRLCDKNGPDYARVKDLLQAGAAPDPEDLQFEDDQFGMEPLEQDVWSLEEIAHHGCVRPRRRRWKRDLRAVLHRLMDAKQWKRVGIGVLVTVVILLETPRLRQLYGDVYGPSAVDLEASLPEIRWIDETSESVLQTPRVSRSLYQAVSHRNPFKAGGSIVEVSVRDMTGPDGATGYYWRILLDETGPRDEITAAMDRLSAGRCAICRTPCRATRAWASSWRSNS
jgi:hypothetical protein